MVTGSEFLMFITYAYCQNCLFTCLAMAIECWFKGWRKNAVTFWPFLTYFLWENSLSASCDSPQKFCCDMMSEIQISQSSDEKILRWQVCLDCLRRDHTIKVLLPLDAWPPSTLTVLRFPRSKVTCTCCLENTMPRSRAESTSLCRSTSCHVVICSGENTLAVAVRVYSGCIPTGYCTALVSQDAAMEKRGRHIFTKQNLIFCGLPSLSGLSAATWTHSPLQDRLQTGTPEPTANDVVALEVRSICDTGNTRRALTAI